MYCKLDVRFRKVVLALALPLITTAFPGCEYLQPTSDIEHVAKAKEFEDKGELRNAVIELKSALSKNPDNAEARRLLGEIYAASGRGADAEKELRIAINLGVSKDALLIPLAKSLLQQGKNQQIVDEISVQSSLDVRDQAKLTAFRGNAWWGLGKRDKAKTEFEQALLLDNRSGEAKLGLARLALEANELDKAQSLIKESLEYAPNDALAWLFQAELLKSKGLSDRAVESYSKVLDLNADNEYARANRALTLTESGKLDEAGHDVERLKKDAPKYFFTHYAAGVWSFAQKKYSEAQKELDEAYQLNTGYPAISYYLGVSHLMQNHLDQADRYLTDFQSVLPYSVQARQMLAEVKLRRGDAGAAKGLIKPVVDYLPNDSFSLSLLGNAELALGNKEQGLQYLKKVSELNPQSPEAKYQLGSQLLASGQREQGMDELKKAAAMNEQLWQPELSLVMAHIQAKQFDEAIVALEPLQAKMVGSTTPKNLLALAYLGKGSTEKAREILNEVLRAEPGDLTASNNLAQIAINEKKINEARKLYDDALQRHPQHVPTQLKVAELESATGKFKEMEERLNNLIKEHPEELQPRIALASYYIRFGQAKRAQTLLEDGRSRFPENAELLSTLIEAQLEDSQSVHALETAKALLKVEPKSPRANYLAARAYLANNDAKAMRNALERSLSNDPKFFLSRIAMVRLLTIEKKATEAKQQLAELSKEYPDNIEVISLQGWYASQVNQPNEAIKAYQTAQAKYPSTTFVTSLAKAQWAAGEPEQALKTLEEWNQSHPQDAWVLYLRSGLYGALGKLDEAKKVLNALIDQNAENVTALNELAWLIRKDEPAKALGYAEKAYELAPQAPQIVDTLAMVLLENKRAERALLLSRQALDLQPDNPSFRYHWAVALEQNGQKDQAVGALKSLLEKVKDFPERQEAEALFKKSSR